MASQPIQLVMRAGPTPGKVYELKQDEITIGRDIGNTIVINDAEISRRHARMVMQAGSYVLEDLGSTNGTFVNGQRLIGPHVLRHGEVVMFGEKVSLEYEAMSYDPNATLISGTATPTAPRTPETYRIPQPPEGMPPAAPVYQPPVYQEPAYQEPAYQQPVYSGQVPPGPAESYAPPASDVYETPLEEQPKSKTWLYVGIGCLVVLLCVCVVGAFAFDSLNLYCTAPFDSITKALGFACP